MEQQTMSTVTTMTGSPRRRRSTFYIPLQATARPILAVAKLVDSTGPTPSPPPAHQCSTTAVGRQQKLGGSCGRALSASALALLQVDPSAHRPPPPSPSSSRRSSPLAFIRRPSSRKLARSSSTIITTGGRWLSSKATAPLRINCGGESSSSIAGDTAVVQQANRSPPIIVIEGSPDEFYRRRRRQRRRGHSRQTTGEDGRRNSDCSDDDDGDVCDEDAADDVDYDDDDEDNHSGQCHHVFVFCNIERSEVAVVIVVCLTSYIVISSIVDP